MSTQQLPQTSPIPEGLTAFQQLVVETMEYNFANGGAAEARAEIKRMGAMFSYRDEWPKAFRIGMAVIESYEKEERRQAEEQEQLRMNKMMMAMMSMAQQSASRQMETQPPPHQQETDLSDHHIQWCLERLMDEKLPSGEPLFNQRSHWQAVFRILADKKLYADSDFDYFDDLMIRVMPLHVNSPYTRASVKMISQTEFNVPFERWVYRPEFSKTRKPFDRMFKIAQRFKQLLEGQE